MVKNIWYMVRLLAGSYVPEMLAITYVNLKKPDSALKYVQLAFQVNMDQAHRNTKDPREKSSANQIQASNLPVLLARYMRCCVNRNW